MLIAASDDNGGIGIHVDTSAPPGTPRLRERAGQLPPPIYFAGSAVFHYLGPSFAVLLFARVDVLGVAWLRIASAALILAIWRRPVRRLLALDRGGRALIAGLGAVFAAMNVCFYISIDHLPLATVAAIEFIGPIVLALIGARVGRNVAAAAIAVLGVFLLTHVRFAGEPVGVAFALANAVLFTAYIVLAHRLSRRSQMGGIDGLAAAMLVAFAGRLADRRSSMRRTRSPIRSRSLPASGSASRRRSFPTCSISSRWRGCRAPPTRSSSRSCLRWRR